MLEQVGTLFFAKGIIGVICFILLYALKDIFNRLMDSQDKRVDEAVENRTAIERNTAAISALADVIKERRS
jgi:hypothetical protein